MSVAVTAMVWRAKLDSTTKLVALRLADFANDDGGSIFPSVGRVAKDCSLGIRAVQQSIRRLEGLAVLCMVREEDPRAKRGREYAFDLLALDALVEQPPHDVHPGTTCTPAPDAPPHHVHPTPAPRAPLPPHHVHPDPSVITTIEPSEENHSVNPPSDLFGVTGGDPASDRREPDVDALFGEWWEAVPRRIAKGAALRAYRTAVKHATPAELLAGIRRYASECARRDPQFVKHPATWLNGRCWLDEPTQPGDRPHEQSGQAPHRIRNGFIAVAREDAQRRHRDADNGARGWDGPTIDLDPADGDPA